MAKQPELFPPEHPESPMVKTAWISSCGRYRRSLERIWNPELGTVCFIGLNPSTADAEKDDPTIRKCVKFARSWGYGGIVMVNLFSWRSTDPRKLPRTEIANDELTDTRLRVAVGEAKLVIAAWGKATWTSARIKWMFDNVFEEEKRWMCLGITKDGFPRHPLYMLDKTKPIVFW